MIYSTPYEYIAIPNKLDDVRLIGIWGFSIIYSHGIDIYMPIEIEVLPMKHGDFPWQTVSHNQMVNHSAFLKLS